MCLQAAQERCSQLRGAVGDPLNNAEILLTYSRLCTVCSLLWQSFWFRSSSERSFQKGLLLLGFCTLGWLSEEPILPLPAANDCLCCSQLANEISALNVLDLYLKLSGVVEQGQ